LLGTGGFGNTYLAQDLDLPGQPVCVVKHLNPKNPDPALLEIAERLFDREAQILYRLGKENHQIPELYAHFEEGGQFYLVQEFVDGHDLAQEIIPNLPLSEQVVFNLLHDILEVLAFIHQNQVIHRDIKPQNIRRRKDGKIVLIDFGAVKEISALSVNNEGQTPTVMIGTLGYMPAEQQASRPYFSSDVYAVGIICFQALTGLEPLKLPRDLQTGELCCSLFSRCTDINPAFREVLDTMVRFDYRQRYQDASAALQALQGLLDIYQLSTTGKTSPKSISIEPQARHLVPTTMEEPKPITSMPIETSAELSLVSRILQTLRWLLVGNGTNNPQPKTTAPEPTPLSPHWEQPEGQVSLNSPFYVERLPIESDCYEAIVLPGSLIRIKAPRQMGKTSLLTRILHQAQQQGHRTVYLNFQSADADSFTSLDKFLQWFCASITHKLNLTDKLGDYWHSVLGSKSKCTNYFQKYILSKIHNPIVLGLDEVDQLFQYPELATDFFALLRVWHETSKNEEIWKKLRLVIVHSKEVYIPLNINQSPFNVGLPIELPEFNQSQVQELVQRHKLDWTGLEVQQLMSLVGGHPYLLRRSLYAIARHRITLPQLLQTALTEEGMYSDHLRRHLSNLQEDANLIAAIKQVVTSPNPSRIETGSAFKLRSMGLVKFQGNHVVPLCDLYRRYFHEQLSGQNL
jgi:serine/threonine-protein kinase